MKPPVCYANLANMKKRANCCSPLLEHTPDDAVLQFETACAHDTRGHEREAVPFYQRALALGLDETTLRSALLGRHRDVAAWSDHIPQRGEFFTFLAIAYYNIGEYNQAVRSLLHLLVETTDDPNIAHYKRALSFYADHLDESW